MDNFAVDVTSTGAPHLRALLSLFEPHHVIGYRIDPGAGLVLYRAPHEGVTPFLVPMSLTQAAEHILAWLAQASYGPEPDHDGHNKPGWRVVAGPQLQAVWHWAAVAAIQPAWAEYGK